VRLRLLVLAALAVPLALFALSGRAAAQASEQIHGYDVNLTIQPDGTLQVTETIDYDFGDAPHHGIFRDIPHRFTYDDTNDRIMPISDVSVTATPAGTPTDVKVTNDGGVTHIRIGDPDRTITGRHVYTINYTVEGALNGFPDHDELYWNAIGADWSVPIGEARAHVQAPADISQAVCFAGPDGSTLPCDRIVVDASSSTATQDGLSPYEGLTVVVALPKGAVSPPPAPILDERWSLSRAFSHGPAELGLAGAVLVLGVGWLSWLGWRVGRDREAIGSPVDSAYPGPDASEQPVPLGGGPQWPVEYTPPDGLRPGQVGTLVDEVANPVDVTATIVDLAVRGYLRIEEIPKEGLFGKTDWKLVRLKSGEDLLSYERLLLTGLFEDAEDLGDGTSSVLVSQLKTKFVSRLQRVQRALYDDAVKRGWFSQRPDKVRVTWAARGVGLTILGAAALVFAIWGTHLAFAALAFLLIGIALIVAAHWMPRRTAKGTGLVRRVKGFREYMDAAETEPSKFAERANLFYEFLPYAVVFGITEKWARAFRGLAEMPQQSFYSGPHPFTVLAFTNSIDSFTVSSAGTIASTPGGSGSSGFGGGGFSGGGGGGGGGGSW
jgi:uncharacterized membrane protein